MKLEAKQYLYDILESIESIESYLSGTSDVNAYMSDKHLKRTIERELEIIGDAMNIIERVDNSLNISSKVPIIEISNMVGCGNADHAMVWNTISGYLPMFKMEVQTLLQS